MSPKVSALVLSQAVPERVYRTDHQTALYAAMRGSPPAPAPTSVAARVQEVHWQDVGDDAVQAVYELGGQAHHAAVLDRTIKIGGWTESELGVLAWYRAPTLRTPTSATCRPGDRLRIQLDQAHWPQLRQRPLPRHRRLHATRHRLRRAISPVGGRKPTHPDDAVHMVDLAALETGTARHMDLQDELAAALSARGVQPLRPIGMQPVFDLAFEHGGARYVVEAKSGDPASSQQVRYGVGQVLEYTHLLDQQGAAIEAAMLVIPVILIESAPPVPWTQLAQQLGVRVLIAADLGPGLDALVA